MAGLIRDPWMPPLAHAQRVWWIGFGFLLVGPSISAIAYEPNVAMSATWLGPTCAAVVWIAGEGLSRAKQAKLRLGLVGLSGFSFAIAYLWRPEVSLGSSLWAALMAVLQGLLVGWIYRRLADSWVPTSPGDLAALLAAACIGSAVVFPLGANPHLGLAADPYMWCWWVVRNTVTMFIGWVTVTNMTTMAPATMTPVASGSAAPGTSETWKRLIGLTLPALGLFVLTMTLSDLPLAWLMLIPAIYAGTALSPRFAAVHSLIVALAAGVLALFPLLSWRGDTNVPSNIMVDALIGAYVFVVMYFSLHAQINNRLVKLLKKQRHRAKEQAEILSRSVESMTEGMLLVDQNHRIEPVNSAAAALLPGFGQQLESPFRGEVELPHRGAVAVDDRFWADVFNGSITQFQLRQRSSEVASATLIDCQVQLVQINDEAQAAIFARDVTSSRQRLDELNNFAATAVHDMRSPITSLRGWLEIAMESLESDPATVRKAIETGLAATLRIDREIDAWLGLAVLRSGEIYLEETSLAPIVEDLVQTYPEAMITLREDAHITGDKVLARQLLTNLVTNAIKYTAPGVRSQVAITVTKGVHDERAVVEVSDNARPIDANEVDTIFEPFHRGSTAETDEGSGFGLSLCRRIAMRHGGWIKLHVRRVAAPGASLGNTFTFALAPSCDSPLVPGSRSVPRAG